MLVAVAGAHAHGKTALVQALTGVDVDDDAEHRSGASAAPPAAPLRADVDLLDLPGLARHAPAAAAGMLAADAVVLCVSASEGVTDGTREQLALATACGLPGIAAVLSHAASPSAVDAVTAHVEALVRGATGTALPVLVADPVDGSGIDVLRTAVLALPPARRTGVDALHVQDTWAVGGVPGAGVWGTVRGRLSVGDELLLLPVGRPAIVTALRRHGAAVDAVADVWARVGLAGPEPVAPGDVLLRPGDVVSRTSLLDVHLDALHLRDDPPRAIEAHHGTRWAAGQALWLDAGFHELRLDGELVAGVGDRVVVRAGGRTLGGGVVLQPTAPRQVTRDERVARLTRSLRALG